MLWIGLVMLATAISRVVGGVVIVVVFVAAVVQIIRGVRDFPRVWRRIGDPRAWSGRDRT